MRSRSGEKRRVLAEAEAGGSAYGQDQASLHIKFKASQANIARPCLKNVGEKKRIQERRGVGERRPLSGGSGLRFGAPETKKPGDVLGETQLVCQQSKDNSRNQAAPGFTCQPFLVSQAALTLFLKSNRVRPIFANLLWTEPALYGKIRGAPFCFPDCVLGQTFLLLREGGKGGTLLDHPLRVLSSPLSFQPRSFHLFIYL